jgi:ADP-ribosyl-[dinitrogen reductase] hydrolase
MTTDRTCNLEYIKSRARAAFIGMAIGDALGAPVEFMTAGEIGAEYGLLKEIVGGGWLRLKPGQVTDDTEMALCIARALVKNGGWSLTAIAENFAAWLKSRPVDVGDTCRRGIRNFMLKGTLETPFNQWDAGNGAVMRMLPAALFTLGDDRLMTDCVVAQARITHNHPLSDAACIYLGRLLHLALRGASKNRLRQELEGLFAAHENFRFHNYQGLSTGYVVDTMQTVFHHFFRSRDFEECLVRTVNQGGDADTTGAIIGALAGAFYGLEAIPKRWLKKMDRHVMEEIDRLATRLIDLSPLVTGA